MSDEPLLSALLSIPGCDHNQVSEVSFTGGLDPILMTPFRVGEAAVASLGRRGFSRLRPLGTPYRTPSADHS